MSEINDKNYYLRGPKRKSARGPLSARGAPRATWAWAGNLAGVRLPPGPDLARSGASRP